MANISQLAPGDYQEAAPQPNISQLKPTDYSDAPAQPDTRDLLSKAGDFIDNNPLTQSAGVLGKDIGTLGGYLVTKAHDAMTGRSDAENYDLSAPGPLQAAAAAANVLLTAATPGAGEAGAPALLKLISGKGIAGGAALGALQGGTASLSAGNTDPGAVARDALTGGAFGGALGGLSSKLQSLNAFGKANSGVTPKVARTLSASAADPKSTESLLGYIQSAVEAGKSDYAPTPTGLMDQKLQDDIKGVLIPQRMQAGKTIGAILQHEGSTPLGADAATGAPHTQSILQNFMQNVRDRYGYDILDDSPAEIRAGEEAANPDDPLSANLADYMKSHAAQLDQETGNAPQLLRSADSGRALTPADRNRILATYQNLKLLAAKPTLKVASDTAKNLSDGIDWNSVSKTLRTSNDPLQGLLLDTRGDVNNAVRQTSPALAAANDKFHTLKDVESELQGAAGSDLSRSALLMRRVFSGDKSAQSMKILNDLQGITGTDYVREARFAKFATDHFGDEDQRTLFQQAVGSPNADARALRGSSIPVVGAAIRAGARALTPDAGAYATALTQGRSYALGKAGDMFDKAVQSDAMKPYMGAIADGLKKFGVDANGKTLGLTSENAKVAAEKLLKSYLFSRLTQPQSALSR